MSAQAILLVCITHLASLLGAQSSNSTLASGAELHRFGELIAVPDLDPSQALSTDAKSANGGVILKSGMDWYYTPFDGSKPVRFDSSKTGVKLVGLDMASDTRGSFYMVGVAEAKTAQPSREAPVSYLARFDSDGKVVSVQRIERLNDNSQFHAWRIAAFEGGYLVISGIVTRAVEGRTERAIETGIFNDRAQQIKVLKLKGEIEEDPLLRQESNKDLTTAFANMDKKEREKFKSNGVIAAGAAIGSSLMDRTDEGDIVIVRKGRYVLSPTAFIVKPDGTSKTIRLPMMPGGYVLASLYSQGHIALLSLHHENVEEPAEGVIVIVDMQGKETARYTYPLMGIGLMLVGWDGEAGFRFLTTAGKVNSPHAAFASIGR
jgi:hypothetical protein